MLTWTMCVGLAHFGRFRVLKLRGPRLVTVRLSLEQGLLTFLKRQRTDVVAAFWV